MLIHCVAWVPDCVWPEEDRNATCNTMVFSKARTLMASHKKTFEDIVQIFDCDLVLSSSALPTFPSLLPGGRTPIVARSLGGLRGICVGPRRPSLECRAHNRAFKEHITHVLASHLCFVLQLPGSVLGDLKCCCAVGCNPHKGTCRTHRDIV